MTSKFQQFIQDLRNCGNEKLAAQLVIMKQMCLSDVSDDEYFELIKDTYFKYLETKKNKVN